jgi:hypothetical protein
MRGKKSKERESDSKGMIVANVTKLVCTSKSQSDSLNGNIFSMCLTVNWEYECQLVSLHKLPHYVLLLVVIDGVTWDGVKFFSLSPQWSRHVKTFPIGLIGPVESCF